MKAHDMGTIVQPAGIAHLPKINARLLTALHAILAVEVGDGLELPLGGFGDCVSCLEMQAIAQQAVAEIEQEEG